MRRLSLRQIEALISVVETGTVSRAAEMMRISQPAASKLIAHLEEDIDMQLFSREGGRVVPTERGMRVYEEADRIFGGIDQLTRAIEAIRREETGQIIVGVIPALSGAFMARAVGTFRGRHPDAFVSIEGRSSQFLADWLVTGRVDVAILVTRVEHATITTTSLPSRPMVCLLPKGHGLCARDRVSPQDLAGEPFVGFGPTSLTRRRIDNVFKKANLTPNIVVEATTAPNVCEFVAAGLGVTIVDPLVAEMVAERVEVRPFDPPAAFDFQICHPAHSRNSALVDAFIEATLEAASSVPP